jgi:hypothetical protein
MIYGVYDYYTSWSSPLVNGYKCKGVKNAKTGIWSFKGGANHRERYPGCTFCPGMIHRVIQVDGKVVWKLKSEHECTPLSIVDLEAEVPAVVSDSVAVSAVAATPAVAVPIEADPAPELSAEDPARFCLSRHVSLFFRT